MEGTIWSDGAAFIRWDVQSEILLAPSVDGVPRKWLPCSDCGSPQSVPLNVVSAGCGCMDDD